MGKFTIRTAFILGGWISLVLGLIGAFLPVLPTTPFVILAAFFFSKGSPRLHRWLITRPYLGKMILEWQRHRVIRMRAKVMSTAIIIPLFTYTLVFVQVHVVIKVILVVIGVAVLAFIWTRASRPGSDATRQESEAMRTARAAPPA